MLEIEEKTPPDAVIWASWGHGNLLVHYTGRGTMGDGVYHPGRLQYALAFPLVTSDYRLAANWITFITHHGDKGMDRAAKWFSPSEGDWASAMQRLRQLLAAGPETAERQLREEGTLAPGQVEQRLAFLFPGEDRPIYLMLDNLKVREYSWHRVGRWDFGRGAHPERSDYVSVIDLVPRGDALLQGLSPRGPVIIGLKQGIIQFGQHTARLGAITLLDQAGLKRTDFGNPTAHTVGIIAPARTGVYAEPELAQSLFHKLYFELAYDGHYFRPELVRPLIYGLWRVQGDRYQPAGSPDAEGAEAEG
jgi:hypothetical protein